MNCFFIYIFPILFFTVYGGNIDDHPAWTYLPQDCGRSRFDKATTRIIKGGKARLGEFPWIGRLGKVNKKGKAIFFCGASLISRYYALSAAHCEQRPDILRLGENYVNTSIDCDKFGECAPPHQDIKIKTVLTEDFCRRGNVNDLMLLELEEAAKFNEYVRPICLPRGSIVEIDLANDTLILAGFGRTSPKTKSNSDLLHIVLPVLDFKACKKMFPVTLETKHICLRASDEGQNICLGDSGGPAFKPLMVDGTRRAYIFGIASFVREGCRHGAAYTKLSSFLDSVLDKISKG